MKARPYVVLQDWMYDLDLTASEALALAVIFGYTMDGESVCRVSQSYLMRYCFLSKQGVIDVVGRLESRGLITVDKEAGKRNGYRVNIEVVKKLDGSRNLTGQVGRPDRSSNLTPSPPHPPIQKSKNNSPTACVRTDARTCEDGSGISEPSGVPPTPQPPAPADDFRFLSSMEREACGFDGDRMAEAKRAKMAAQLDRYRKTLADEGLPMDDDQRRRFLDHWCAHRPGCAEIRAEGDPYFSVPAKARRWVEEDRRRSAAGNTSKFADATSDWRNGDF